MSARIFQQMLLPKPKSILVDQLLNKRLRRSYYGRETVLNVC